MTAIRVRAPTSLPLATGRALAWALLLAGWIGSGALGFALAPLQATALWPTAALLAGLGAAAAAMRTRALTPGAASLLLALAALAALALGAIALQQRSLLAAAGAALAWAVLLVLAARIVRLLRATAVRRPAPVASAAAGALLAWAALGDPADLPALALRTALLTLGAVTVLVAFAHHAARAAHAPARVAGCHAGLFDCALPSLREARVGDALRGPPTMAAYLMLPMMGSLAWMIELCRADGLSPALLLGAHLAAMFVPPLAWRVLAKHWSPAQVSGAIAALLVAGGAAQAAPPLAAMLLAAAAQGAAWSLAWVARLQAPRAAHAPADAKTGLAGALLNAVLVLALAAALSRWGAAALTGVAVALGAAALALLIAHGLRVRARSA